MKLIEKGLDKWTELLNKYADTSYNADKPVTRRHAVEILFGTATLLVLLLIYLASNPVPTHLIY